MKKVLILDPFIKEPVNNSFNQLVDYFPSVRFHYFQPSFKNINSLENKNSYDGIFLLGSGSNIGEDFDWHEPLMKFHKEQLARGVPTLGICFGHQLLAYAYGCEVGYFHKNEEKIEGSRTLEFKGKTYQFGVSHRQVVTKLSSQFDDVSKSQFQNDFIIHKELPLWCTQAHPEGSADFLENTCMIANLGEQKQCIQDGMAIIHSFLKEFKLL